MQPVAIPTRAAAATACRPGPRRTGPWWTAKCFEDLGYYVVDNLPAELIATLMDLGSRSQGAVTRLAVVMDVRSRAFSSDLRGVIRDLDERGHAAARALPRGVRRRAGAPVRERAPRAPAAGRRPPGRRHRRRARTARAAARRGRPRDRHRPTARCTSCATRSRSAFAGGGRSTRGPSLRATVVSFGFKYGLPVDADLVVDVRFLPNPYWIPELRELTGTRPGGARLRPVARTTRPSFLDRYTDDPADHRRRLPPREQAVPDPRRRLHRRQAPLGRDGPAARRRGSTADGVRRRRSSHRDLGRE